MGIIKSLLDNDLYKFSMGNAVFQLYPRAHAEYKFIDRGLTKWPDGFWARLWEEVQGLCELKFTCEDVEFLRYRCPYLTPTYLEWLDGQSFNLEDISVWASSEGFEGVTVTGPWYRTILYEVPLMAIISELFFRMKGSERKREALERVLIKEEMMAANPVSVADFGTRRRFSYGEQDRVINVLRKNESFIGTSNVYFAQKYNLKPIGTMAHEWIMAHGAMYGFVKANEIALEKWTDMYQGNLGIALPDTYTTKAFLKTFGKKHAKLFDGVRQDSGDPIRFADMMIKHYMDLDIDPMSKTIVFSDSLDMDKVLKIKKYCEGRIKYSFGMGTNLTNDVGVKPLNMVIKMDSICFDGQWDSVVKLSDDPRKHTGDKEMIKYCKYRLGL